MTDNTSSFNMSTAVRAMDGAISRMVQSVLSAPANLAAELDGFQQVRAQTLAMLGELTEAQAMWSPRPGVWSVAQIADHLLRSEDIYRDQFQRVIRLSQEGKGTSVQVSLRDMDMSPAIIPREILPFFETPLRIFNYFVPAVLRETMVRFRIVPALNPKVSEPRAGLALGSLRESLAAAVRATAELFQQPLPANVERLTIDHALMGNNTIPGTFRIMTAHEERHQAQITELRALAGFPHAAA